MRLRSGRFAEVVETAIHKHPKINLVQKEVTALPQDAVPTIVATGPLRLPHWRKISRAFADKSGWLFMMRLLPSSMQRVSI